MKQIIFSLILSLTFSEKTTTFDETEHCMEAKNISIHKEDAIALIPF